MIAHAARSLTSPALRCAPNCIHTTQTTPCCSAQNLHNFIINTQNAFFHYDKDRSGALDKSEVHSALTQAGFRLEQPAFECVFATFDPDSTNTLSLAEFMGLSVFLQSCSLTFQAFDAHRSGRVTLDFSQFVYAASNTR